MIKQFAHKGLENFFLTGNTKGIQVNHALRLRAILDRLDDAIFITDMNIPGSNLHPLNGDLKGLWSVNVPANWRITFKFVEGNAYIVDYHDYH